MRFNSRSLIPRDSDLSRKSKVGKIVRGCSEILDKKMGNELHFYLGHFWKGRKIGSSKTNKQTNRQINKQTGSPSHFHVDFGDSTSQVYPSWWPDFFLKQINQHSALFCPVRMPWERIDVKPHEGVRIKVRCCWYDLGLGCIPLI